MASGIRATVSFDSADICPIVAVATTTDSVISSVSTSVGTAAESGSVTEFVIETESPPSDVYADRVFSYGTTHIYRLDHDGTNGCPCECLGEFDSPIHRYLARPGMLELVFHAANYDQLQVVMRELRARFPDLDIRRLVRSPTGDGESDTVFVDRAKLTDRQLEILQLAYDRGYFDRPRGANASEIAAELGINQSTVSEHLVAAQRKIFGDVLEDGQ